MVYVCGSVGKKAFVVVSGHPVILRIVNSANTTRWTNADLTL